MKKTLLIGLGISLATLLVLGGLGWAVFAYGPMGNWTSGGLFGPRTISPAPEYPSAPEGPDYDNYGPEWGVCGEEWYGGMGMRPGMMGSWGTAGAGSPDVYGYGCPGAVRPSTTPTGARLDLEDAHEAVERYLERNGLGYLRVREVMEFSRNFYAIVEEPETGMGAMELLIDRWTGLVGPEMGPNMMWNAKYGMMGRGMGGMMGSWSSEMRITPGEAVEIAQEWLDSNLPGQEADEHADAFYGYYTLHTLQDGRITGMLSVHGTTGQVWYHTWHGQFLGMLEADDH